MSAVLEQAIRFEERSYRYYERALQVATREESFKVLKEIMGGELEHRMKLQEALRSGELQRLDGNGATVPEGETDGICEEWPPLDPQAGIREVLETALSRERCAAAFYRRMRDRTRLEVLKSTFDALFSGEREHIARILDRLENGA
ncbi:MAG: hypothetical protein ACOC8N_01290 [Spirochaetota bacterium]